MNQCQGCQLGLPIENGFHKGAELVYCTKDRYTTSTKEVLQDIEQEVEAFKPAVSMLVTDVLAIIRKYKK